MNKSFRSVFNEETGTWVAVAENVKANGKKSQLASSAVPVVAVLSFVGFVQAQVLIGSPFVSGGTGSAFSDTPTQNGGIAIGGHSTASAIQTIALGGATASADSAIALGWSSMASGENAVVLGAYSTAADQGVAVGANVTAAGYGAVAIGGSDVTPILGASIGGISTVPSVYSSTRASGNASVAYGSGSFASTDGAAAIGSMATASGSMGTALGLYARATSDYGVALGAGSVTDAPSSTAAQAFGVTQFGAGVIAGEGTNQAQVSVGSSSAQRRVVNVAAGAALTDAVNVSQLKAVNSQVVSLSTSTSTGLSSANSAMASLSTTVGSSIASLSTVSGSSVASLSTVTQSLMAQAHSCSQATPSTPTLPTNTRSSNPHSDKCRWQRLPATAFT